MVFGQLQATEMMEQFKAMGISCFPMWGTIFYSIYPEQDKVMTLKNEYKLENGVSDLHSESLKKERENADVRRHAGEKMGHHDASAMFYVNPDASLKLHLSLNNITDLDEETLTGLVQLLKEEAESPDNNINFHFKIISPECLNRDRFKMNDQITIYFDKYTSSGDLIRLSDKVETFLKERLPENTQPMGPKDRFGLNSFVSARFDNNKLLNRYNVYPFFDLELQKFFKNQTPESLDRIPLCALESVFNKVISSPEISISPEEINKGLNDESSSMVQAEFEKMLRSPKQYMGAAEQIENVKEKTEQKILPLVTSEVKIHAPGVKGQDFDNCISAMNKNDLDKLKSLIEQNPDVVDQINDKGLSLLHYAASYLQLETVHFLLTKGAKTAIESKQNKSTALSLAISAVEMKLSFNRTVDKRDLELINSLAKYSPDNEQFKKFQDTVTALEEKKQALINAEKAKPEIQIETISKEELTQQLFDAIINVEPAERLRQLIKDGADPHQLNERGWTTVIAATRVNNKEALDLFIDLGVNLDTQTASTGMTALMIACHSAPNYLYNNKDLIDKLLSAKANTELTCHVGKRASDYFDTSSVDEIDDPQIFIMLHEIKASLSPYTIQNAPEKNVKKLVENIKNVLVNPAVAAEQVQMNIAALSDCVQQCNSLLQGYGESRFLTALFRFKDFLTGQNTTSKRQQLSEKVALELNDFEREIKEIIDSKSEVLPAINQVFEKTLEKINTIEQQNTAIKEGGRLAEKISDIKKNLEQIKESMNDSDTPTPTSPKSGY